MKSPVDGSQNDEVDLPIYIVDAFTTVSFKGNPAAVCLCTDLNGEICQAIAAEMNLSETAFLQSIGDATYRLRWFTPTQEVPLCGHATLASAHVIWTELEDNRRLEFQTLSGVLTAVQEGLSIQLDFPTLFTTPLSNVDAFERALGCRPNFVGTSEMFHLAELDSESQVRALRPEMAAVGALGKEGVIVTARSETDSDDFVSRLFAPNAGVPEDPVTGSAHCALAHYWSQRLGRTRLTGYQASKRGGFVKVEFLGARTLLTGDAVTVLKGTIKV